jgi:hypothetical protein
MTREDVIAMAREAAQMPQWSDRALEVYGLRDMAMLERFAALVADAEAKRMHDEGMVTVGHMRQQIAAERERWKALRDRIQADLDRPEGRWGMHGHSAVDDDYFVALEWVLERMDENAYKKGQSDEREACAKRLEAVGCDHCAANIRARGAGMTDHEVEVILTPERIKLHERAMVIGLPSIIVSMYGNKIQKLIDDEREACAKVCEEDAFVEQWKGLAEAAKRIRARGQDAA